MENKASLAVFGNAKALFVLQIANYVLPFVLIPYLTKALGAYVYGVVAFGLAISQIAFVITDYGFALSATYLITRRRDDLDYVRKVTGSVFIAKTGLFIVVALLLAAYLHLETKYSDYNEFFWLLLLTAAGQAFQPIWFFQGMERMGHITLYTLMSRLLYLGLVLLWVKKPDDYYWIAVANGLSHISAAALGICIMRNQGVIPVWPGLSFFKQTLAHSTEFFWSRAAVATYTAGGAFFLGLVSNPLQVAYYSAAEQLYRGGQSLFAPLAQALYPHMARHRNFGLLFRTLRWTSVICLSGAVFGLVLGPWFIRLLFGSQFNASFDVLMLFLLTLAINTPSVLLGYPLLGALGQTSKANRSVLYGGTLQVVLLSVCYLMQWHTAVLIAATVLLTETLVLILRTLWGRKHYLAELSATNSN